jgi:MFS family permease
MLLARVALGVVTATTGPTVASLTGDYFSTADRARVYGLILTGDLAGSGLGYLVSGDLSSVTTWRAAYWWLAVPSLVLAWVIWRLPEPARGGYSRIPAGATGIRGERKTRASAEQDAGTHAGGGRRSPSEEEEGLAQQVVRHSDVQPEEELVLREEPTDRSIWCALRYVLRVRTDVVIILASALGYFYFAGLRSFAVLFATATTGSASPSPPA